MVVRCFAILGKVREDMIVYLDDRLLMCTAKTVDEVCAGYGVELDDCYTCSILASIVLFLHEEVQFIEGVGWRAVFFYVEIKWLQEPDEGDTALVFYSITHLWCEDEVQN